MADDSASAGHIVDSSDYAEKISPELAALDAAMAATDGMADWQLFRRPEAHARILDAALKAARPLMVAAECERLARITDMAIAAEREATRNWSGRALAAREDILEGLNIRLARMLEDEARDAAQRS